MSLRYFEGQDHAMVYAQFRPVPPPTLIQRLIGFLREKYEGPLNLAVDLGCGNGQCTFTLANDFLFVRGIDISEAQVQQARESGNKEKWENVKFEASPGEKIPIADNSAQLITICQAAHYMDLPKVYEEAKRVLSKNGVFSIVGYHLPKYSFITAADDGKAEAINQVVDKGVDAIYGYFPKQALAIFREYDDVTIPFSDFTRERGFTQQRQEKICDIIGTIRSYSPFQFFMKDKGEHAGNELLEGIANGIVEVLNEGRQKPLTTEEVQNYEFVANFRYFVLMGRA